MCKRWLLLSFVLITFSGPLLAAQTQSEASSNRRVISKVVPVYPHLARQMSLQGTVKLEVLVSGGGSVKSVDVKGGSPLLVQSAQDAVRMWRWEKTDHETTETIEFNFHP